METELRKILLSIYKGKKENNDEAVEQILLLFGVSKRPECNKKDECKDIDYVVFKTGSRGYNVC